MNRPLLFFLLFLFFSASCTVYKEYPIEVYRPGEVAVPATVRKVGLLYRNFKYPGDTLQHYYQHDYELVRAGNDPANPDSLLVSSCLNALADQLKTHDTFDEVQILPYSSFDRHTGEHLPDMPEALARMIGEASGADLLISLEMLSSFYAFYPGDLSIPESGEVITAAVWGVYDLSGQMAPERKSFVDTVYWDGYDEQGNYQRGTRLPPRLKALEIASALVGERYAKRFRASWEDVTRMYIIPPLPDFSEAAYYFEEGKWDQAITLWKRYAGKEKGKLAINARYNLALVYEMKDDIPLAVEWLDAAHELALAYRSKKDLSMIRRYQGVLSTRQKELNRSVRL